MTHRSRLPNRVVEGQTTPLDKLKFFIYPAHPSGFAIIRNNIKNEWVVDRISSQETWEHGGIRPGDVLESIAEVPVRDLCVREVHTLLTSLKPASILRFRVDVPYDQCRLAKFRFVLRGSEKLGVLVTSNGPDCIPVVHSFSQDLKVASKRIQLGDVLVAVNDVQVIGLGLQKVVDLVSRSPRPVSLMFQRWAHDQCSPKCCAFVRTQRKPSLPARINDYAKSSKDTKFSSTHETKVVIVWRGGSLGVTLIRDSVTGQPMVNRLTGKGTPNGLHRLYHGCILTSINSVSTSGRRFRDVTLELSLAAKPLELVFVQPSHSSVVSSVERSGSSHSESIKSSTSDISSLCSFADSECSVSHDPVEFGDSTESSVFNVEWREGELGVQFCCQLRYDGGTVEEDHEIVVGSVEPQPTVFPSTLIAPGDHLLAVNGVRLASDRSFVDTMTALKMEPKPVVLTFERPISKDEA